MNCHTQRRTGARRLVVAVVVGLVLLAAVPSTAGAEGTGSRPARTVPLQRWVRSVCTGLSDWNDALNNLGTKVQEERTALDSDKLSANRAKARMRRDAVEAKQATDRLIAKVKEAGTPQATNGESVARSFSATLADIRSALVEARRSFARLKARESNATSERAKAIQTALQTKADDIGDPLEGPRADQEFATALNNEPACTDLLPQPAPTSFVVGDCITASKPEVTLEEHVKVACGEPHLEEVFAVTDHPAGPAEPFPGEGAVNSFAEAACTREFQAYVGIDFDSSQLGFGYYTPNKDSWPVGDHQIVCVADHEDNSPLTGSVKGTAQ